MHRWWRNALLSGPELLGDLSRLLRRFLPSLSERTVPW